MECDFHSKTYHLSSVLEDVRNHPELLSAVTRQLHGSCAPLVRLQLEPLHEVGNGAALVELVGVRHAQGQQDLCIAWRC